MISIVCDSCKKAIPNAMSGVNFFYVTNKSLCKACEKGIEEKTRDDVLQDGRYTLKGYRKHYLNNIEKQCR
jgi:hypothetical protein